MNVQMSTFPRHAGPVVSAGRWVWKEDNSDPYVIAAYDLPPYRDGRRFAVKIEFLASLDGKQALLAKA